MKVIASLYNLPDLSGEVISGFDPCSLFLSEMIQSLNLIDQIGLLNSLRMNIAILL
jgi:hypothetical protein